MTWSCRHRHVRWRVGVECKGCPCVCMCASMCVYVCVCVVFVCAQN